MRILISGGGIAGLTLAYWLHHFGMEPVVIEQADTIRRDGYAIDFFGTGYDVAERMGIIESLCQHQLLPAYFAFVNTNGQPVVRLDMKLMHRIMHGRYMALMHWTLEEILYQAIASQVDVRFGQSLDSVEQRSEDVLVTFNSGSTERFDLLIGADGVHSRVRSLVFGKEEQFSKYLGYGVACYTMPDHYGIGNSWQNLVEPGRLIGAYGSGNPDEITTVFMYRSEETAYVPREQRLSRLQQVFSSMGWITDQVLRDITDHRAIFMDVVMQVQMSSWHNGRVALVGDACGCTTLISGQGASLAMGGAYILAQALYTYDHYQSAFKWYEQVVHPQVSLRQKKALGLAKSFVPDNHFQKIVQMFTMKFLFHNSFVPLLRTQLVSDSFLTQV